MQTLQALGVSTGGANDMSGGDSGGGAGTTGQARSGQNQNQPGDGNGQK